MIQEEMNSEMRENIEDVQEEQHAAAPAEGPQALKKALLSLAHDPALAGVRPAEIESVKVALDLLRKAMAGNVATSAVKTPLAMVNKGLTKVQ